MLAKQPNTKVPKINLYHLLDNTHAASNLMIYFPESRIMTQADVSMELGPSFRISTPKFPTVDPHDRLIAAVE